MKTLPKISILILAVLSFSCVKDSSVQDPAYSPQFKYPESFRLQLFTPPVGKPLIQVNTKLGGMYWLHGDFLEFRLHEDGLVEFDDCPLQGPQDLKMGEAKTEDLCVRKQTRVIAGEVSRLRELLQTEEFKSLKFRYSKIVSTCDAVPLVNFHADGKDIEIGWCDSLSEPQTSPNFPQILSILFRHFEDIKSGRYSDPPLIK
jgi:hypothetical protein